MFGGGDKIPNVATLEKPEKLNDLLREESGDDCTPCRLIGKRLSTVLAFPGSVLIEVMHTGSGAFLGLAAYNYISGMGHLERQQAAILKSKSMFGMRSRRLGVASISMGLAYLGILRWFR